LKKKDDAGLKKLRVDRVSLGYVMRRHCEERMLCFRCGSEKVVSRVCDYDINGSSEEFVGFVCEPCEIELEMLHSTRKNHVFIIDAFPADGSLPVFA